MNGVKARSYGHDAPIQAEPCLALFFFHFACLSDSMNGGFCILNRTCSCSCTYMQYGRRVDNNKRQKKDR